MNHRRLLAFTTLLVIAVGTLWGAGSSESSHESVEIEFFQQKREVVEIFDEIIERFEAENPGITVKQNSVAENSNNVLMSRMATDDVPAALTHWPNNVNYITAANEGFFVDLTDDPLAEAAYPDIIESITLDNGRNYAIPISINTQGIFYNQELFEKHGLTIPGTWDEFIALCEEIQGMGETPIIFPDKTAWTIGQQFRMSIALDMDGYSLIDEVKAGRADARESEGLRQVGDKLLEMRQYAQYDPLGTSYEQAIFEFANGDAFMFWQGIWAIPSITKANPDLDYSMFALPALNGRPTRVEYGVDLALVLGKRDSEAESEAARKFVDFVASSEIGQFYADRDGSPSALKGVEFNSDVSAPLVEYVQNGQAFRNIRHKYAPGGNPVVNSATQQFIIDGDMDAWLEQINVAFGKPEA